MKIWKDYNALIFTLTGSSPFPLKWRGGPKKIINEDMERL
jgi:hypothetical protein